MSDFLKINLSNNIAILIIIIMFFFCILLLIKNKKLKEQIEDLKLENNSKFNQNQFLKEDIISINSISNNIKEEKNDKESKTTIKTSSEKEEITELPKLKPIREVTKQKKESTKNKIELYKKEYQLNKIELKNNKEKSEIKSKPYTKNILQTSSKITSPVSINTNKFDINEFIKKEPNQTTKKINRTDYLKQVSDQIANEIKPQTIELTDYEKEEEENAIISYKELLNVKDQIKILDDEETGDFIEDLKKLRNSLN